MPTKYVALRYMTGFECIGPQCEDHCCGSWAVDIDEGHFQKLKRTLKKEPAGQVFERAALLRPSGERNRQEFARIALDAGEDCPMLDAERLCSIQRKHGGDLLPDVCSMFPRTIARVGDRLELSGDISCPEAARRLLLHDDATELVEAAPGLFGRLVSRPRVPAGGEAHQRLVDKLRRMMFLLLRLTSYPLESRLFFIAQFAHANDHLFVPSEGRLALDAILESIENMESPLLHDQLHHQYRMLARPTIESVGFVAQLLGERLRGTWTPSFRRVLTTAFPGAEEGITLGAEEGGTSDGKWVTYQKRKQAAPPWFAERAELYFENYCKYYWFREWHHVEHGLIRAVQLLLGRLAALRILLFTHPAGAAALEAPNVEAGVEQLDRFAVDLFYSFSRHVEHDLDRAPAAKLRPGDMAYSIGLIAM